MKTRLILVLLGFLALLPGCKSTLEPGGPYAPEGQKSDMPFFAVEGAFDIAYSAIDAVFKFERDNRVELWKYNPDIKRTLDKIRPESAKVVVQYARARSEYIKHPTRQGLSAMEQALSIAQRLASTAGALIPKGK